MASDALVTAVIRSKDKEDTIAAAIESVLSQSVAARVVLVDSGSRDSTVSIAEALGATIVRIAPEDFTYGRAINVGVGEVETPYALILSAHCALPRVDWLEDALSIMTDDRVAGLNGYELPPSGSDRPTDDFTRALVFGSGRNVVFQRQPSFGFVGFSNHAALIRTSVAQRFTFDENLPATEDKEWANRVVSTGMSLAYSADLRVPGGHRRKEGFRSLFKRGRKESAALSAMKNASAWTVRDALAHMLAVTVRRRGLRRLSAIRPANLVESFGRLMWRTDPSLRDSGSGRAARPTDRSQ